MLNKYVWAFVFLWGLIFNSVILLAQKYAVTNDGKKVILYSNNIWKYDTAIANVPDNLELPKLKNNQTITYHSGFALCYNKTHEQSNWVAYQLTQAETQGIVERSNKFKSDPKIKGGTASDADYKQSGYDRGHLAPAADMSWSETSMQESFYYSNMSPQVPSFNRGIWKKLEEQVRNWAVQFDDIYVATGPVLTNGLPTIGFNKVSVPQFYYKALLVYGKKGKQAIAFVLPNLSSQQALNSYVITIDSLEVLTGIDFFAGLIDEEEDLLESITHIENWSMTNTKANVKTENDTKKKEVSALCKGISKSSNTPCKLRTNNANGYCHHHQSQAQITLQNNQDENRVRNAIETVQCSGTTKAGNRCKRKTTNVSGRCYQH